MKRSMILVFGFLAVSWLQAQWSGQPGSRSLSFSYSFGEDSLSEDSTGSRRSTAIELDDDWENRHDEQYERWLRKDRTGSRKRRKHGFFRGGAGGWDFYYLPLNLTHLNNELVRIELHAFDPFMIMSGGGGWGFIGNNIRVGGLGAHGRLVSSGIPASGKLAKKVSFTYNFGGFTVDKVFHPFSRTEIACGIMIGGGDAQIRFSQWGQPVNWNDLWSGYDNDSLSTVTFKFRDYQNEIHSTYWCLMPSLGLRYNVFRWAAVGFNVGYLYSFLNQEGWIMDNHSIGKVPELQLSNLIYRFNIYFGG